MAKIYYFSSNRLNDSAYTNYTELFKKLSGRQPDNAIMLLYDNEWKKSKPLYKFVGEVAQISENDKNLLKSEERLLLLDNLYLIVTPMVDKNKLESDIEMLFEPEVLGVIIDGKKFCKSDQYDRSIYYGKNEFAKYVMRNYEKIDFSRFKPLLNNITRILDEYGKRTAKFQPPAVVTENLVK